LFSEYFDWLDQQGLEEEIGSYAIGQQFTFIGQDQVILPEAE
jgi:hypothetical protein